MTNQDKAQAHIENCSGCEVSMTDLLLVNEANDKCDTDPTLYRHIVIQLEDCPVERMTEIKSLINLFVHDLRISGLILGSDFAVNAGKVDL